MKMPKYRIKYSNLDLDNDKLIMDNVKLDDDKNNLDIDIIVINKNSFIY